MSELQLRVVVEQNTVDHIQDMIVNCREQGKRLMGEWLDDLATIEALKRNLYDMGPDEITLMVAEMQRRVTAHHREAFELCADWLRLIIVASQRGVGK